MPTVSDEQWVRIFLKTMKGKWRKGISDKRKEEIARELLAEAQERGREAAKRVADQCTCHFTVPEYSCPLHDR